MLLLLILLFLEARVGAVARVCAAGVARRRTGWWIHAAAAADATRAGGTSTASGAAGRASTFTTFIAFGLRDGIFVLRFAVHVIDVVGAVGWIVNLLPAVRQLVFGALFKRLFLDLGQSRVQPL